MTIGLPLHIWRLELRIRSQSRSPSNHLPNLKSQVECSQSISRIIYFALMPNARTLCTRVQMQAFVKHMDSGDKYIPLSSTAYRSGSCLARLPSNYQTDKYGTIYVEPQPIVIILNPSTSPRERYSFYQAIERINDHTASTR